MALAEIEFELPATQYELMGYPGLRQGESLAVVLDAGVLLPDPLADSWFAVRQEPLPAKLALIGPATYAFAGQIVEADLFKSDGAETGVVLVQCGDAVDDRHADASGDGCQAGMRVSTRRAQ